jgi:hypothetical protein
LDRVNEIGASISREFLVPNWFDDFSSLRFDIPNWLAGWGFLFATICLIN